MRLFKCDFGDGVTCEVQIPDDFETLTASPPYIQGIAWTGKPTKKTLRPYIAWMNSVWQQLANEWNQRLCRVYQTDKNTWEFWDFTPGKNPKMEERYHV